MGKYLDLVHEVERHVGTTGSTADASVDENLSRGTNRDRVDLNRATTLTTETTETPCPAVVALRCFACRGHRFWISVFGVTVCAVCHPPADPSFVAQWITPDGGVGA